jgi:predicted nucleic acid-binding protein
VDVTRLCLDTSAYSHFKRGDPRVVEILDRASWLGLPSVVLGELRTGFALGARAEENERELQRFIAHPVVTILDVDDPASRIYAEIVVALRAAGTPLPTNDLWIAAVAAREGASVLTFDRHFEAIGRVGVVRI